MKDLIPPYIPSGTKSMLMKAALLKGEKAIEAWQAWKSKVALDDIDYPSLRMLPMLYQNLSQNNASDDPDLQRMKGIYRLCWVKNQLLFRQLTGLLSTFQKLGIEMVVLKGAALVFGYYHDYGIRPMHDLDVLIKSDQTNTVSEVLTDLGWRRQHHYSQPLLRYRRELVFANGVKQEIDVHWHLLREWCMPRHDSEVWDNTTTITMNDLPVTVLNPTFSLMHVCGHGYQWEHLPSLLWIADMRKIITTATDQIEWDRLLAAAESYRVIVPMRHVLSYLSDELETPVPTYVLQGLMETSWSSRQVMVHDAFAGNPTQLRRVLRKHWLYYTATQLRDGKTVNVFQFVYYFCLHFQDVWDLKRWWHVPIEALKVLCNFHNSNGTRS